MTALELVKKYEIYHITEKFNKKTRRYEKVENMIQVVRIESAKADGMVEEIKARKAEIIEAIENERAEKKAERERRDAAINAIEGLAEIRAAQSRIFAKTMKIDEVMNGDGDFSFIDTTKEEYDFEEAYRKYPRATAFLKAEKMAESNDETLAAIGKKALDSILFNDWEEAVEAMNKEKNEHEEKTRFENVCYSTMKDAENNISFAHEEINKDAEKARQIFEYAIKCAEKMHEMCLSPLASEKQRSQFEYVVDQLRVFIQLFQEKTGKNVDELRERSEKLTQGEKTMTDSIISTIIDRINASNALKTSFELTINEFTDRHEIDKIEAESRARGFNSCAAYEDDGTRRYYCDDLEFVSDVATAAIVDVSSANVTNVQNLLSFLINGGFEPEIEVEEAHVIGGGYSVEYRFENVDWTTFNWEQAVNEYAVDGESDDELIENVVRLFYEI